MTNQKPLKINKTGRIEGTHHPEKVECTSCGSKCRHTRNIYEQGKPWTEWACPKCVKEIW